MAAVQYNFLPAFWTLFRMIRAHFKTFSAKYMTTRRRFQLNIPFIFGRFGFDLTVFPSAWISSKVEIQIEHPGPVEEVFSGANFASSHEITFVAFLFEVVFISVSAPIFSTLFISSMRASISATYFSFNLSAFRIL